MKILFSFLAVYLLVFTFYRAEIKVTYPEKDISCVEVETLFGSTFAPAGCFRGDIYKDDNCLDVKATVKYQQKGGVIFFEDDTCKEVKTPAIVSSASPQQ